MKSVNLIKPGKFSRIFTIFVLISGFVFLQMNLLTPASAQENVVDDQVVSLRNETQRIIASDGAADDSFGTSTAIDGDTAIVGVEGDDIGANSNQGSAYVFIKNGGVWVEQAKLVANDGAAGDAFGGSVAINGNTVIIGARNDAIGANSLQGSAYIFTRNGTTWTQQAKITASDGALGDNFGGSVDVEGDSAVIGAVGVDIGGVNSLGAAYVFTRSGTAWSQQAKIVSGDTSSSEFIGDSFGTSVSISGNTIIAGNGFDTIGGNSSQGSAYIFVRSGSSWSKQTMLIAADGAAGDGFGRSCSISGDTVVVAALSDDIGANVNQGSAYVYTRSGTSWTQQAKLVANDGGAQDFFGIGGAEIDGNTVVVGTNQDAVGSNAAQGSVYLFTRSGTSWTQQEKFSASDGSASDGLGSDVAVSGSNIIAGATGDDIGANSNQGSAYIFSVNSIFNGKSVGVFRPTNGITYLRNSNTGGFADISMIYGVNGDTSIAGDWNGDRIDSLGIYRNGVFYLRNSNTTGPADIVFAFGSPGDQPIAGDWNGDGIDTIGVYHPTTGVFMLRNSNTAGAPDVTFVLGNPGDVAIAGDWNGDGITTTGVFRPTNGIVYLKNTNVSGDADIYLVYGVAGDKPVAGDWNADGIDSIGIYRNGVFYLRNSNTQGNADIVFAFGNPGDEPIAGDWDGLP